MKKILFMIFISISLFATEELDDLLSTFSNQYKLGKYKDALITLDEIQGLGVKLPSSSRYFKAKALYNTGKISEAYEQFTAYRLSGDTTDILYKQSKYYLSLIENKRKPKPKKVVHKTKKRTIQQKRNYVCYDYKNRNSGQLIYHGCRRSNTSCRKKGLNHFGAYPSNSKSSSALRRCQNSNPRFVD